MRAVMAVIISLLVIGCAAKNDRIKKPRMEVPWPEMTEDHRQTILIKNGRFASLKVRGPTVRTRVRSGETKCVTLSGMENLRLSLEEYQGGSQITSTPVFSANKSWILDLGASHNLGADALDLVPGPRCYD